MGHEFLFLLFVSLNVKYNVKLVQVYWKDFQIMTKIIKPYQSFFNKSLK